MRQKLKELRNCAETFIGEVHAFSCEEFEKEFICENNSFRGRKFKVVTSVVTADEFDYSVYQKRFSIFNEEHSDPRSISNFFLEYIKTLLQQGRIGSAINYLQAKSRRNATFEFRFK